MSGIEIIPETRYWSTPMYWDSHSFRYRDYRQFPQSPPPKSPPGQIQAEPVAPGAVPVSQTMPDVPEVSDTESLLSAPEGQEQERRTSDESNPWECGAGQATPRSSSSEETPARSDDDTSGSRQVPDHSCDALVRYEEQIWNQVLPGYNLCFHYQHKSIKDLDAYHVIVLVRTENMEKLMKKGLHLNKKNATTRMSSIIHNTDSAWISRSKWKVIRSYEMSDTSFFKNWEALIWVYANTLGPLASFRVRDLTPDNCAQAKAWNKSLIYFYDKKSPDLNINTLLDEQPMEGIWPWPRAEPGSPGSHKQDIVRVLQGLWRWLHAALSSTKLSDQRAVRVFKGIWAWLCAVVGPLEFPEPDAVRRFPGDSDNLVNCVFFTLVVIAVTILLICACGALSALYSDVAKEGAKRACLQAPTLDEKCRLLLGGK